MAIYKVTTPHETRFVRAKNQATAINHVLKPGVTAESLSADDVVDIPRDKIETADASDEKEAA